MKNKLVDHIRKQFSESWLKNQGDPSRIVSLMEKINPNALMIGFAKVEYTYSLQNVEDQIFYVPVDGATGYQERLLRKRVYRSEKCYKLYSLCKEKH